jgi:hypothetical protein
MPYGFYELVIMLFLFTFGLCTCVVGFYELVVVGFYELYELVGLCTCRRCNGLVWTLYTLVRTCMDYMHLLYVVEVLHILLLWIYIIYVELYAGNNEKQQKSKK